MNSVNVKSYAKINLTLDIVGEDSGYHLLDSFVANVDLYNLVTVKKRKDKLVGGRMLGMGMDVVPFETTNACKVAEAFVEKFQTTGAEILIYENIPVGAGLGGSSADSAGVLKALAKLYDVPIEETYGIANAFGSDIRYLLDGGYARMQGRGERVEKITSGKSLELLLLCPKSSVSAGACYKEYDRIGAGTSLSSTSSAIQAYEKGEIERLAELLSNDLFSASKSLNRDVETAYEELKSFSPLGVSMTGSGSAVFAIFETREFCEWAKSRYRGKFRAIVTKTVEPREKKTWKNPFVLSKDEQGIE